jgi:hypothetical protein
MLVAVLAAVLWWQRTPLLNWYYLRSLGGATDSDRAVWVERLVGLDGAAVPGLLGLLRKDEAQVCANAEVALSALAKRWGGGDPRTAALAVELTTHFSGLSTPGREAVLEWYLAVLRNCDGKSDLPNSLEVATGKVLMLAAQLPDRGVRIRTLALAEVMLAKKAPQNVDFYRDLAVNGLAAKDKDLRAGAIRLTMHAPLHTDKDLLDRVVPMLKDAAPEVRRAAVLAVGLAEDNVAVQDMLPLLQDTDAEVRRLCEAALRGRGLQDSHLKLAKLISDHRPGERLRVVQHLHEADDLDPVLWLMHLSQDASPAVRAAAIRFATADPAAADFQERVLQMSDEDPSPTVRQLALHYLKAFQRR